MSELDLLEKLKGIKKEELSEREFYEQVLSVIKEIRENNGISKDKEAFVKALREIGCMDYKEWKKVKHEAGELVEETTIDEGIKNADIATAVSLISNYMHSPEFMETYMDDRVWDEEWIKSSMEHKLKIPYYQVAEQALMNWNGLSKEEADNIINTQSFDEIESQVYATGSMNYAIEGVKESLSLTDRDTKEFSQFVYEGKECGVTEVWRIMAKSPEKNKEDFNNLIMDTLFHVHDGWVKDNTKKFNAREKKHQHMPSELIGWKEAKADLLFVKPIFEAAGIEVNEEELEQVYNDRVKNFFLDRGIETTDDLANAIAKGKDFYPALEGYGDILTTMSDPDYVKKTIIPAIEQQGIGNVEQVRQGIVSQITTNPTPEDVERLSDKEKSLVEQSIGKEVSDLTSKRDELHKKNSIVQRIMNLMHRRKEIEKEIEKEISEEEKIITGNFHNLDD